jgi:hypothetical protein
MAYNRSNLSLYATQIGIFLWFVFLYGCIFFHGTAWEVLSDPDGFWHVQAGKLWYTVKSIPQHDPWSFTAGDYRWYNLAWIFDIIVAHIDVGWGRHVLQALMVLLYAGLLSFLCYVLVLNKQVMISASCLMVMLVSLTMWEFFSLRPHIFTYFLVVVFYAVLRHGYERNPSSLFFLPLLVLLWVNLHGGFLAGFVMMGAFGFSAYVKKHSQFANNILLVSVLSLFVLPINPYGFDILSATLRSLSSPFTLYIDEWRPFIFGQYAGMTAYYIMFVVLGICLPRSKEVPLYDKVLVLIWAILAVTSIRHFPIFALLSAPYLALRLSHSGLMRGFVKPFSKNSGLVLCLISAAVVASIAMGWLRQGFIQSPASKPQIAMDQQVVDVLRYYSDRRFLNDYAIGGWLIYNSNGAHRVFIDSRAGTAYPESLLNDYMYLFAGKDKRQIQLILEKYGINAVVTQKDHPFAALFKSEEFLSNWQIVFEGEHTIVFIKTVVFASNSARWFSSETINERG